MLILSICTAFACGRKKKDHTRPEVVEKEEVIQEGVFRASLMPLNSKISNVKGQSTIWVQGKQIYVRVKIRNGGERVEHMQAIHSFQPCPSIEDDLNEDGYIDYEESILRVGNILIPLDSDLNSQQSGIHNYPITRKDEQYFYSEAGDITKLLKDLRADDEEPRDHLCKLKENEDLNLLGRTIMIYGLPSLRNLPPSVAAAPFKTQEESIPVACGEIGRVVDQQWEDY
jgi:hypothetical protein